ncbi:MAG TPA: hypothetical protein EYF95_09375 [Flavobacteriales bacterium]|nr:hypothetical protein [Flavobacteriales bacterium]HIK68166.1 hypothetical protein [Flavobacteriales bacterium]
MKITAITTLLIIFTSLNHCQPDICNNKTEQFTSILSRYHLNVKQYNQSYFTCLEGHDIDTIEAIINKHKDCFVGSKISMITNALQITEEEIRKTKDTLTNYIDIDLVACFQHYDYQKSKLLRVYYKGTEIDSLFMYTELNSPYVFQGGDFKKGLSREYELSTIVVEAETISCENVNLHGDSFLKFELEIAQYLKDDNKLFQKRIYVLTPTYKFRHDGWSESRSFEGEKFVGFLDSYLQIDNEPSIYRFNCIGHGKFRYNFRNQELSGFIGKQGATMSRDYTIDCFSEVGLSEFNPILNQPNTINLRYPRVKPCN